MTSSPCASRAATVDRDGFTTNLASSEKLDGLKYWTGRLGIMFKPTATIDNYLMLFNTTNWIAAPATSAWPSIAGGPAIKR